MCECKSCLTPAAGRSRLQAFVAKVHNEGVQAKPGFWTAYAQGYLAALEGRAIPARVTDGCHMVDYDFRRGHADALAGVQA